MKLQPKNINLEAFTKLKDKIGKLPKKMPPLAGKVVPPDVFKPNVKELPIRAGFAPMPKAPTSKKVLMGAAFAAAAVAVATAIVNVVKNIKTDKVEKETDVKPQEVNVPEMETTEVQASEVTDISE